MFISDKLVFVELHKTGCTHIGMLLASLTDGAQFGKHNPPPPNMLSSGRKFLGSIRNPWDFYVSLWAYGCGAKGLIYHHTTRTLMPNEQNTAPHAKCANTSSAQYRRTARKPDEWRRCYSNVEDASAFRDWLHMMNDENYWHDFGEGYGGSVISKYAGLLTYRYLSLFCRHVFASINGIDDIKVYEKNNCYIDYFIRTEHLEDDFISALESCKIHLNDPQKRMIYSAKRTNTSSRTHEVDYFYDDETLQLVRKREAIIIEKFAYAAPGL